MTTIAISPAGRVFSEDALIHLPSNTRTFFNLPRGWSVVRPTSYSDSKFVPFSEGGQLAQGTYKDVRFAFPGGYSMPFDLVFSGPIPGNPQGAHQSSLPRVYFDAMGRPWSGEIQALDEGGRRLHFQVRAATNAALKPGKSGMAYWADKGQTLQPSYRFIRLGTGGSGEVWLYDAGRVAKLKLTITNWGVKGERIQVNPAPNVKLPAGAQLPKVRVQTLHGTRTLVFV